VMGAGDGDGMMLIPPLSPLMGGGRNTSVGSHYPPTDTPQESAASNANANLRWGDATPASSYLAPEQSRRGGGGSGGGGGKADSLCVGGVGGYMSAAVPESVQSRAPHRGDGGGGEVDRPDAELAPKLAAWLQR